MTKVFISGSEGTTGLRLRSRLETRPDVELLEIDTALRKDAGETKKLIDRADIVFLCLPDDAARETVALAAGSGARIIDTSTAHRTAEGWAYGFPELSDRHRSEIVTSKHVASPGCHASGFISLIYPLISVGILKSDCLISCTSLTGYSGGGKKMIAEYEDTARTSEHYSPKPYAMNQSHKHLPEIVKQCGLENAPVFLPVVGDFYAGMLVTVPLHVSQINGSVSDIREVYRAHYKGSKLIKLHDDAPSALFTNSLAGRDNMEIFVSGSDERIILCSRFDNLGKGASGAAIQCFNLMCGMPEETGLTLG